MQNRIRASLSLSLMACALLAGPLSAEPPFLDQWIRAGLPVTGESNVKFPSPTLVEGMSAAMQQQAIANLDKEMPLERFTRKSVNSPFILKMEGIHELPDKGQVQQIDLWFVAHGRLEDVANRKLFEEMGSPEKKDVEGPPEEGRELTGEELSKRGLIAGKQADGTNIGYGIVKANILDKVYLTGITTTRTESTQQRIVITFQFAPSLADDVDVPSRWYPYEKGTADGRVTIGKPQPYTSAGGYGIARPLLFVEGAIFVELHIIFAEPHAWFGGKNLLRSKLPNVMQDYVRTFRRKLAAPSP